MLINFCFVEIGAVQVTIIEKNKDLDSTADLFKFKKRSIRVKIIIKRS